MWKLKYRQVKWFFPSHTASKGWSWNVIKRVLEIHVRVNPSKIRVWTKVQLWYVFHVAILLNFHQSMIREALCWLPACLFLRRVINYYFWHKPPIHSLEGEVSSPGWNWPIGHLSNGTNDTQTHSNLKSSWHCTLRSSLCLTFRQEWRRASFQGTGHWSFEISSVWFTGGHGL